MAPKLSRTAGKPVDDGMGTQSQVGPNFTTAGNNGRGSTTPGNVALGGFGRGVVKPKFNSYATADDLGNVRPSDIGLPESPDYGKVKGIKKQINTYHATRGKVGF